MQKYDLIQKDNHLLKDFIHLISITWQAGNFWGQNGQIGGGLG